MNLFIDSNIFLSFFHFTSDDLEELKKLSVLIRNGDVVLYVPVQVRNEFKRNREAKIADALKQFEARRFNERYPQLCKDYPEYKELQELQRKYEIVFSTLQTKMREDIQEQNLKADQVIGDLFR